jgi:hypothetical protein
MSQQTNGSAGSDAHSEFGRLQRLPGFSRMQRQLFFNLMTAKPDISDGNIRIDNFPRNKKNRVNDDGRPRRGVQIEKTIVDDDDEAENGHFPSTTVMAEGLEPSLGRSTIKNISRLIIDRDGGKVKPPTEDRKRTGRR